MDKTTHSCKRYRQKRDSWVGQKHNTTSKPQSVGNLKSSLLETVPLFIPTFFHTARKHLQKGLPGGQYPFSLPRKKHTNASTLYTTIPYNHSVRSPTCPGDLSEGAGDEGKQRADYICSLSIRSHEKFAQFPSLLCSEFCPGLKKGAPGKEGKTEEFGGSRPTRQDIPKAVLLLELIFSV